MQILKADTEVKVRIGPFLAVANGYVPVTNVTLGSADEAELLKHNGAATVDISASTWAAISSCDGWYDLTLTTGNLDTEGLLTVVVQDDSVCLPVHAHFMVVNANVYDSLYGTAAADYLQVDALQLGGATQSATDLKDFADAGYDPGTNKVQGVVLTDTCTTNTDMVGTDSAALASVCTEARLAELAAANIPADLDAALADTNELQGLIASSKIAAQVKSIDTDVITAASLNADAVTEIWAKAMSDLAAGAPSATASALTALNYLYEAWRNKTETTATEIALYKDDASTKLMESNISDDGTTFTKGEYGAAD